MQYWSILLVVLLFGVIALLVYGLMRLTTKYKIVLRQLSDFQKLCDLIQVPIWFKDRNLRFTWVNKFYAIMFDRQREEVIGLSDLDIAPKKLVDNYIRDDEYVLESKKVYRYKENEKAGLWYDTTKFPLLDENGELYGLGGVAFNITAIKKSEKLLHNLVHNDYLTGVSNRLFLSVEVTKRLSVADEHNYKLAIILLDIDNFKDLNDLHGHVVGDEILKSMSERLREFADEEEVLLGRFGGDEFIIVVPEVKDEQAVMDLCGRVKEILAANYQVYNTEFSIETSMGISFYPDNSTDYEGLIRHADMALFYAKAHGRNTIVKYSNDIGDANLRRIRIETRLKSALVHNEFFVCYQPKVSSDGCTMVGMEALIRWINPDLGFVPPSDFIPVAEQSDVIIEIGDWVLRTALLQNLAWSKENGGEMYPMAVNLSVKQIAKPDFLKKVLSLLDEISYPPAMLELEITERMLMSKSDQVRNDFEKLRSMGVKISVDDFGTGYSNLGYLSNFPLDEVKIDRSFVTDIEDKPEKQQIVKAIIQLAKSFNLSLIAEGVETSEELEYLRSKGVNVIQGYYFSKPLKAGDLGDFVHMVKLGKYNQENVHHNETVTA